MDFRVIPYEGVDQVPGHQRYSILYGPLFMAAIGSLGENVPLPDFVKDERFTTGWVPSVMAAVGPHGESLSLPGFKTVKTHTCLMLIAHDPARPREWLKPRDGQPLAFDIEEFTEPYLMP